MAALQLDISCEAGPRTPILTTVIGALVLIGAATVAHRGWDTAASDFSCFWAGAKAALHDPHRLFDFDYVTGLQGWPLGPSRLRPFIYPPSSLPAFIPFALLPFWGAYALWSAVTVALFFWAGLKARAPWWFILFPAVAFAVFCGQTTLLIGGLAIGGLALLGPRPLVAGLLFGAAAAVKPQLLILVPVALAAEGRWRTLLSAGLTTTALVGLSVAIWGVSSWFEWLSALQRFQGVIFNDVDMVRSAITPYAALEHLGLNGAWAWLLAPLAPVAVWIVFRRTSNIADRTLAIFGGALALSPYAMNYEAALLAPAVATYLARTQDRRWLAYALAAIVYASVDVGVLAPLAAVSLPAIRRIGGAPQPAVA